MPPVSEFGSMSRNRFLGQEPAALFPEADLCAFSPAMTRSASRDGISFAGDQDRADDQLGFDTGSNFTRSFELHEDPNFWKDNNVQVIIRIRPLNSSEISLHGHRRCVRQDGPQALTWVVQPQARFTFDIVADENVTQEKLFKVAGVPMVENCMGGYNSCMFAYGQTGSGKTHTMLGDIEGGTRRHNVNCGMTPRVFEYLFSRIQKEKEARKDEKLKFTCRCSFLEIYNEHILDLLEPSSSNLQIREDARKGVYVENITEFEVSSAHDVMQRLLQGAANRKVAATNMNHASSRSHSVFTCAIESKWEIQGVTHHRFARLNLVDLAGSERQKSSGAEGDRLKEATNINKSLSTLGLVIMNLVNISNGKSQHVPYRDSKLTFLLQDSLGGNSKTIIIANISPSNCCSLETLSTLKFAQRAKFIRNNAIVNEDALGDVFAMRMQIQQLKKEVNRLRALANGGSDHQEIDSSSICFPGSPGPFTWDALHGPLVPLTSDEKNFKKRDLEAAMVASIRREQDKEASLKALTEQHQATLQLAKQREAEIQSLKMRLRFREAGIKRWEALASSKITAGEHLLQEKMELLKEIDVLRGQVDRNLEVTRFAMENLTLKEELKKFQSFYDGEREMLVEQVDLLQDKLAEALEWKLMHEKAMDKFQEGRRETSVLMGNENNLFTSIQDISSDMDYSFISDENEVLQVQAIQYQRELEAVRKNLKACLDVKEKLERRVGDLVLELEEEKKATANLKEEIKGHTCDPGFPSTTDPCISVRSDPVELKAMVDAIAAASQREAQAHETAIFLEKENIELRKKVKVLLEDNAKLIEMYEGAVSVKVNDPKMTNIDSSCDQTLFDNANMGIPLEDTDDLQMKNVKFLEQQLQEIHEENDKLMGLYEKAMQERDDLKRMLQDAQINRNAVNEFTEDSLQNSEPVMIPAKGEASGEELKMALKKLDLSVEMLVRVLKAMNMMNIASCDIEKFLNEIETSEANIWMKEQEIALLNVVYSETGNMKSRVDDRLHSFKDYTLKLSETSESLDQREAQARAITDELSCLVNRKQKRAIELQTQRENLKSAYSEAQKQEISTTNIIANLRSRLEVSKTQRKETEDALFADCTNRPGLSMEGMQFLPLGKAAELLKSEEERIKLSAELKDAEGKLKQIRKEARLLKTQYEALDVEFQSIKMELTAAKSSLADASLDLSNLISERERVMQLREAALEELQFLILDYQTVTFELYSKLEERMVFEEELQAQLTSLRELEDEKVAAMKNISQLLGDKIKIEEALRDAQKVLFEAKASLVSHLASLSL